MERTFKSIVTSLVCLTKLAICLPVALTALAAFLNSKGVWTKEATLVFAGVLLIAIGAAILNQYLERDIDKKMERTKDRPLVTGEITPKAAIWLFFFVCAAGAFTLSASGRYLPALLAALNLFWYNFVYTPLKTQTPFAVVPGALVGAVPPLIGWAMAGGSFMDIRVWLIAFLFFMAQMPHFWILQSYNKEDYKEAGLETITTVFTPVVLRRIIGVWITATAVTILFLPLWGVITDIISTGICFLSSFALFVMGISLFRDPLLVTPKVYFRLFNLFILFVTITIGLDPFL